MSTRCCITVRDDHKTFHVYKHCDGYPEGVAKAIEAALPLAWELPRFEADDWAAAFVAGNKPARGGGNIYFSNGPDTHQDLEYRYEVYAVNGKVMVDAYARTWPKDGADQGDGDSAKGLTVSKLGKVQL